MMGQNITEGERKNSIVSFSSQIFSAETLESGETTAKRFNILTWKKM